MKAHQSTAVALVSTLPRGAVLDAGSGSGEMGDALREKGFRVVSLDLYDAGAKSGRFVLSDMNANLPFKDAAFDYVLCSESLQYIENHSALFREFCRVVKKSGSVIISMPNVLSAASRFYFFRRGYFPHFKPVRRKNSNKGWDTLAYNPATLVDIMEKMKANRFELKAMLASKIKAGNMPLYALLKATYSAGLIFERNPEKARLVRLLSSREALMGDHLVMRFGAAL